MINHNLLMSGAETFHAIKYGCKLILYAYGKVLDVVYDQSGQVIFTICKTYLINYSSNHKLGLRSSIYFTL